MSNGPKKSLDISVTLHVTGYHKMHSELALRPHDEELLGVAAHHDARHGKASLRKRLRLLHHIAQRDVLGRGRLVLR